MKEDKQLSELSKLYLEANKQLEEMSTKLLLHISEMISKELEKRELP